ncbi:MAG: hypothetical protein MMC33_000431 [Icmadophila ericetorum]|nr:hypothetical protein [Icmadophila ericetorum]
MDISLSGGEATPHHGIRDAGVSDAVWAQLQADKNAGMRERKAQDAATKSLQQELLKLQERNAKDEANAADLQMLRDLEAELKHLESEHQAERRLQRALRGSGACVVGYEWIKQADGYRCAGGSHFLSGATVSASLGS